MTTNRTGSLATALALTAAATVAVAPAHAAPVHAAPAHAAPTTSATEATTTQTAQVHYVAQGTGSASGGSLENEFVQAGLLLVAGVGVSALLAISAGVGGGAIDLPEIPGLPI